MCVKCLWEDWRDKGLRERLPCFKSYSGKYGQVEMVANTVLYCNEIMKINWLGVTNIQNNDAFPHISVVICNYRDISIAMPQVLIVKWEYTYIDSSRLLRAESFGYHAKL